MTTTAATMLGSGQLVTATITHAFAPEVGAFVNTDSEVGKIVFEIGEVLTGMQAKAAVIKGDLKLVEEDVFHFQHVVLLLTRAHKQSFFTDRLQQTILQFYAEVQEYDRVVVTFANRSRLEQFMQRHRSEVLDASTAAKKTADEVMKLLATDCPTKASLTTTQGSPGRARSTSLPSFNVRENDVNLLDAIEPRLPGDANGAARVYKAIYAGISVAVKFYDANETSKQRLTSTLAIWQRLHHAHICRLYGVCYSSEQPFVVMELCDGGSLDAFLRRYESARPVVSLDMLIHAGEGLLKMHAMGIVHNDFKVSNILVSTAMKQAKVSHFDRSFDWTALQYRQLVDGTAHAAGVEISEQVRWLSPECIEGKVPSTASDVYAFGLAIYEALTGEMPYFDIKQDDEVKRCVLGHELPARDIVGISDGVWTLIKKCCDPEPHQRPTMEEILRWLRVLSLESRRPLEAERYQLDAAVHASIDVRAGVASKDVCVVVGGNEYPDPKQPADYTAVKPVKARRSLKRTCRNVVVLVVCIFVALGVASAVVGWYFSPVGPPNQKPTPAPTPAPTPPPKPFVTTIAAYAYNFTSLQGITITSDGTIIYLTDEHRILQMTLAGNISVYSGGEDGKDDGLLADATFSSPAALALSSTGDLYVCDIGNRRVRKITGSPATASQFTGDNFVDPQGIAVDSEGNVYVADGSTRQVAKVSSDGSDIESFPMEPLTTGVAITKDDSVYFTAINAVYKLSAVDGTVTMLAGDLEYGYVDGPGADARFNEPGALAIRTDGNLYIADTGNHCIRKLTLATNVVTTYAGVCESEGSLDGEATSALFTSPLDITAPSSENLLYIIDGVAPDQRVRKIYLVSIEDSVA